MIWKHVAGALAGGGLVYLVFALRAVPTSLSSVEAALDNPVPTARADISGTRLKSKAIVGADGSRLALADVLYDSELDFDCVFRKAADGTMRCLPPDIPGSNFGWGVVAFTDDQCENGLVWVQPPPSGCSTVVPKYALVFTDAPYCTPVESSRDAYAHVHPVGALLPPPAGPLYRIDGSGACVTGGLQASNAIPYAIGDEIPAASFASGTAGTDP